MNIINTNIKSKYFNVIPIAFRPDKSVTYVVESKNDNEIFALLEEVLVFDRRVIEPSAYKSNEDYWDAVYAANGDSFEAKAALNKMIPTYQQDPETGKKKFVRDEDGNIVATRAIGRNDVNTGEFAASKKQGQSAGTSGNLLQNGKTVVRVAEIKTQLLSYTKEDNSYGENKFLYNSTTGRWQFTATYDKSPDGEVLSLGENKLTSFLALADKYLDEMYKLQIPERIYRLYQNNKLGVPIVNKIMTSGIRKKPVISISSKGVDVKFRGKTEAEQAVGTFMATALPVINKYIREIIEDVSVGELVGDLAERMEELKINSDAGDSLTVNNVNVTDMKPYQKAFQQRINQLTYAIRSNEFTIDEFFNNQPKFENIRNYIERSKISNLLGKEEFGFFPRVNALLLMLYSELDGKTYTLANVADDTSWTNAGYAIKPGAMPLYLLTPAYETRNIDSGVKGQVDVDKANEWISTYSRNKNLTYEELLELANNGQATEEQYATLRFISNAFIKAPQTDRTSSRTSITAYFSDNDVVYIGSNKSKRGFTARDIMNSADQIVNVDPSTNRSKMYIFLDYDYNKENSLRPMIVFRNYIKSLIAKLGGSPRLGVIPKVTPDMSDEEFNDSYNALYNNIRIGLEDGIKVLLDNIDNTENDTRAVADIKLRLQNLGIDTGVGGRKVTTINPLFTQYFNNAANNEDINETRAEILANMVLYYYGSQNAREAITELTTLMLSSMVPKQFVEVEKNIILVVFKNFIKDLNRIRNESVKTNQVSPKDVELVNLRGNKSIMESYGFEVYNDIIDKNLIYLDLKMINNSETLLSELFDNYQFANKASAVLSEINNLLKLKKNG